MAILRTLYALSAVLLLSQARRLPGHRHEAFDIKKIRQADPVAISALATPTGVLTIITPSPGASPVQVTKQSQIVTSYIPQYTLCDLPPVGFFHLSRPSTIPSTAPFKNYSMTIPPGNGSCTTIFEETATMVCATTLTDLTTTYPVTRCAQDITFSTEYDFVLVTPTAHANSTGNWTTGTYSNTSALITPAPSIRRLTSYLIAPWQQLTSAGPPEDVDIKVCATLSNGTVNCIRRYQVWHTSLVTINATSTTSVNFTTTIAGPSQLIIATYVANLTQVMQTVTLHQNITNTFISESLVTNSVNITVSTGPTVFQTRTVEEANPDNDDITSTITRRITSTIKGGTTTITIMPSGPSAEAAEPTEPPETEEPGEVEEPEVPEVPQVPQVPQAPEVNLPTPTSSVNWASMLGADQYRQ